MKYCSNCGKEVNENAVVCVHCGCAINTSVQKISATGDAPDTGMAVLGFFIPLVGLILYLMWQNKYPLKAKSAGKGALIGFIANAVLSTFILMFSMM